MTLVSAWPQPAQAYLDPGTGSMFLQLVVGGVAGLLVLLRLYWARLKRLFGFGRADVPEPTPPSPDDE